MKNPGKETKDNDGEKTSKNHKDSKENQASKRKAVYDMLKNELKLEAGNMVLGCVCLIGSTASNAGMAFTQVMNIEFCYNHFLLYFSLIFCPFKSILFYQLCQKLSADSLT